MFLNLPTLTKCLMILEGLRKKIQMSPHYIKRRSAILKAGNHFETSMITLCENPLRVLGFMHTIHIHRQGHMHSQANTRVQLTLECKSLFCQLPRWHKCFDDNIDYTFHCLNGVLIWKVFLFHKADTPFSML